MSDRRDAGGGGEGGADDQSLWEVPLGDTTRRRVLGTTAPQPTGSGTATRALGLQGIPERWGLMGNGRLVHGKFNRKDNVVKYRSDELKDVT